MSSPSRPLVIAHRGASHERPEHTLAAYQRAIEAGADGVECDIRLTRDGHLVCIHDRRLERTSSGRGAVSATTLAELARLDFGSWHSGDPADVLPFADLLDLLALHRPGGARLLVETKHPTRHRGAVERALITALDRHGYRRRSGDHRVVVMSFAGSALRRVHRSAPDLPTVLLMDALPWSRPTGKLPPPVGIAGPSVARLRRDPSFVARAHALGHQVYVWTVDEPADLAFVTGLGVDAVITNRPAEAIAGLPA